MSDSIENATHSMIGSLHPMNSQYGGMYRGTVVNNDDPLHRGRCKIFIRGVYSDEFEEDKGKLLPWAEPSQPLYCGGIDRNGTFQCPDMGSTVWCFFESSDTTKPVFFGQTTDAQGYFDIDHCRIFWDGMYNEFEKSTHTITTSAMYIKGTASIDMSGHADIDAYFDCGNNATVNVGKNTTVTVGEDTDVEIGKNTTVTVGEDTDVEIGKNIHADIKENANMTVGGDVGMSVGGDVDIQISGNSQMSILGSAITKFADEVTVIMGSGSFMAGESVKAVMLKNVEMKSPQMDVYAGNQITLQAPKILINGELYINGVKFS